MAPKQTIELECTNPNIQDALSSLGTIYPQDKSEVFKPAKSIHYKDKEYEFNKFCGKYFSTLKYTCTDINRCRGAIRIATVDPLKSVDILRPHASD